MKYQFLIKQELIKHNSHQTLKINSCSYGQQNQEIQQKWLCVIVVVLLLKI